MHVVTAFFKQTFIKTMDTFIVQITFDEEFPVNELWKSILRVNIQLIGLKLSFLFKEHIK